MGNLSTFIKIIFVLLLLTNLYCKNENTSKKTNKNDEKESTIITIAAAVYKNDFHVAYANDFKRIFEKKTNGKYKFNIITLEKKNQSEQEIVLSVSDGEIQMGIIAINNVTPFVSDVGVFTLPYIFTTTKKAKKVFKHPIMKKINKKMITKANIRSLAWLIGGYRVLTNSKKPVKTLNDLKDLKVRVPENTIMIETFRSWGIEPIPLAWNKVYSALESKIIDGQENPHQINATQEFYKVQRFITDLHYILWIGSNIINEDFYQSLPLEIKNHLLDSSNQAMILSWKYVEEKSKEHLKICIDNGMKINKLKDEKKWKKKARSVWPKFYNKIGGKKIINSITKITSGY